MRNKCWRARSIKPSEGSRSRGGRGPMEIECGRKRALVKKIVSGKVQFFPTNSTIQSWGCVKREKVLNPGGRWGLWNCARRRLTDERGGAMGQASWRSSFLGHRSAKFFAESESCGEQPRKSLLWQSSRPLLI